MLKLPPAVLRTLAGAPVCSPEGFVLDTETQILTKISNLVGHSDWAPMGVHKARKVLDHTSRILSSRPEGALAIHDEVIRVSGGVIRARVYRPAGAQGALPAVVYYHGGGFVLGSLRSHDGECRAIALHAGAVVVSVDYRLAPEHRFPAAVDDGTAAYLWAVNHAASLGIDPRRIAVAGDSAGGNIAAVVAQDLRDHPERPVFQCLIYPATDLSRSTPSHQYFAERFLLTGRSIDWFMEHYLPKGTDARHPRASPLFAQSLADLPPALVVTAGFDPLRDEGRLYAEALSAAGTRVEYKCYEGLIHAFLQMSSGPRAAASAVNDILEALRIALAAS